MLKVSPKTALFLDNLTKLVYNLDIEFTKLTERSLK